ncbi:hypothetical protein RJT34_26281 [Clitoria ternatea]|uniref:FBD domain-containing protein n=1 Tax=Clitoria ternatea TaxID=43366 RepID=A0AAN9F8N5_CLITE
MNRGGCGCHGRFKKVDLPHFPLSHLQNLHLRSYQGSEDDKLLVGYMLQNAAILDTIVVKTKRWTNLDLVSNALRSSMINGCISNLTIPNFAGKTAIDPDYLNVVEMLTNQLHTCIMHLGFQFLNFCP